jgi:hypothetical protein
MDSLVLNMRCRRPLRLLSPGLFLVAAIPVCLFGSDKDSFESPDTRVALIELYTSEGCSSCPPAEAWLGTLKGKAGLWSEFVPISFHVDYWNYLGWTDRFSSPKFTQRQRDYSVGWNQGTIYTPEFVLNGEEWRPAGALPSASKQKPGKLRLRVGNGDQLEVSFIPNGEWKEPFVVEIAPLAGTVNTNVKRGENAGRQLQHSFIALALISATLEPSGNGEYAARLSLPDSTAEPIASIAAWVRPANSLVPIQAAGGWLSK